MSLIDRIKNLFLIEKNKTKDITKVTDKDEVIEENKNDENSLEEVHIPIESEQVKTKTIKGENIILSTGKKHDKNLIPEQKTKTNAQKKEKTAKRIETTISQSMSLSTKEIVKKICLYYYVKMQPEETKLVFPARYYELLTSITKSNSKSVEQEIQSILKNMYKSANRQQEYIKKYDKLQSILESNKDNRRAIMELVLILINEGYSDVAKKEYKDEFIMIEEIISKIKEQRISIQEAKKALDEVCL